MRRWRHLNYRKINTKQILNPSDELISCVKQVLNDYPENPANGEQTQRLCNYLYSMLINSFLIKHYFDVFRVEWSFTDIGRIYLIVKRKDSETTCKITFVHVRSNSEVESIENINT